MTIRQFAQKFADLLRVADEPTKDWLRISLPFGGFEFFVPDKNLTSAESAKNFVKIICHVKS